MASWLAFSDQPATAAAVAVIDGNMHLPVAPDAGTATWAIPCAMADGRWAIPRPDEAHLAGVEGYAPIEGDPEWAEVEG